MAGRIAGVVNMGANLYREGNSTILVMCQATVLSELSMALLLLQSATCCRLPTIISIMLLMKAIIIWPVARDFRPSGEKLVFEKMAIKIVVKKLRGVNDTVLLLDLTGVYFGFVR